MPSDTRYEVEHSYAEDLSVAYMADACGYSKSHFMKLFRQMTCQTFNDYLTDYRLMIASNMLKTGSARIIDIALDCGFKDAAYFSTCFLKHFGMSPELLEKNIPKK